jgi:hypothetical protein
MIRTCRLGSTQPGETRFPGIPLDNQPLVEVCRKTDNRGAHLSIVREKTFDQIGLRNEKVTLEAVGEIHSLEYGDEVTVCGIITKNPFFRKPKALTKSGLLLKSPMDQLCDIELLSCALKDWHDVGDVAERYYLTGIQSKWVGSTLVVRPSCTWTALKGRDFNRHASTNKQSRPARTKVKRDRNARSGLFAYRIPRLPRARASLPAYSPLVRLQACAECSRSSGL